MQAFKLYLAGGIILDIMLPQEAQVTAEDFRKYLIEKRTQDGITEVNEGLTIVTKALLAVEKVQV